MPPKQFDLFVIGGGSGGVRAARIAAGHGARVGICEEYRYGGTCVIRGCVPKKLLVYAAHFAEDFEDALGYGWSVGEVEFDWSRLIEAKNREIARLEGVYRNLLKNAGVEVFEGRGTVTGSHHVQVGEATIEAEKILVATGARPWMPDVPGGELAICSDEAFELDRLPERVVIVGGGYIACEFAGIFRGLGSEVCQVYRGERVLRGFDDDVRRVVCDELGRKGVNLKLECTLESIEKGDKGLVACTSDGGRIEADQVMYATGRHPNTDGLGLEAVGVEIAEGGKIIVDKYSRSSVESIFAVGDVTDRMNLTPVAIHEGHAFADTQFGGMDRPVDHDCVPSAVFSQPPVGVVGLTEAEARNLFDRIVVYRSEFRPLKHTLSGRDERTMMKLVVDQSTDRVLGVHIVGMDAPEIVQGFAVAVKSGTCKSQFDATIGIHPTAAEELVTLRTPAS